MVVSSALPSNRTIRLRQRPASLLQGRPSFLASESISGIRSFKNNYHIINYLLNSFLATITCRATYSIIHHQLLKLNLAENRVDQPIDGLAKDCRSHDLLSNGSPRAFSPPSQPTTDDAGTERGEMVILLFYIFPIV